MTASVNDVLCSWGHKVDFAVVRLNIEIIIFRSMVCVLDAGVTGRCTRNEIRACVRVMPSFDR